MMSERNLETFKRSHDFLMTTLFAILDITLFFLTLNPSLPPHSIKVDVDVLTDHFTGIKTCCLEHDVCYGRCGKTREECDAEFEQCLKDYCKTSEAHRHDKDLKKSCDMASKILWKSAYYMGCNLFIEAKKKHCYCALDAPHIEF